MARKKQRTEEPMRKKKVHTITALSVIFVVLVLGVIFGWGSISKMFTANSGTDAISDTPILSDEANNEYYEAAKSYLSSMTLEDKISETVFSNTIYRFDAGLPFVFFLCFFEIYFSVISLSIDFFVLERLIFVSLAIVSNDGYAEFSSSDNLQREQSIKHRDFSLCFEIDIKSGCGSYPQ